MSSNDSRFTARASFINDALRRGPVCARSGQGFPAVGRRRDVSRLVRQKNLEITRIATLNIGSLTGRSIELAAALEQRHIDICALQETRWSGAKSHLLGNGYKVLYNGGPRTRNGVGIVVSERFRNAVAEVHRFDDRLMKLIIILSNRRIHFFSAYAPQTGCTDQVKDAFWSLLDDRTAEVPPDDYIIIAGDLNGHVGVTSDGCCGHGGHGFGARNDDGERILDYADTHNLIITNTWFRKRPSHLATYYSGDTSSQIDYVLVRRQDMTTVLDAKVIPYETTATQHRPVICKLRVQPPKESADKQNGPARIKWWKLKEKEAEVISRIVLPPVATVDAMWKQAQKAITDAAKAELGLTKPGRRWIDRVNWLWTDDVQAKVREKKHLYHAFLADKTPENWQRYRSARSAAKATVAAAKAARLNDLYKKLDTREGERDIYRVLKTRHQRTEDIEKFYGINDNNGQLISNRKRATSRWRDYFEQISTEEFPHPPIPQAPPVLGPIPPITVSEVTEALRRMRPGKTTGPDDLAAEVWRSQCWNAAGWLTDFFNRIISEGRTPADWQRSTTIPIWKKKGNPAECSNYRPIRLLAHTMKIFERIIDHRIRDIVRLTINQAGFVKGCGTTDAIHAARLLFEKHQEKRKPLYTAFLDLEKAFDRVPHDAIWYALRCHGVPEELVNWVKMLYREPRSCVRAAAGTSKDFRITVGVHQGSALSPLLFVLIMDTITSDLQRPAPWTLLYADDVMLASGNKADLQQLVQAWNDRLAEFGLRLNVKKTEYLTTDLCDDSTISVNGADLPKSITFKYLGSTIAADGSLIHEARSRINATWLKWRTTTGITCDKKISDRLKSKIYRSVIRPVALYGTECWPATKEAERRLNVMETKMLRWISGITRFDHARNDDIRKRYGIAPISDKLREARLRWYGHALRAGNETLAKVGLQFEIGGKRPKGRPKQRWLDTLHHDLKIVGIHPDQAHDRIKWRQRTSTADPATARDKR